MVRWLESMKFQLMSHIEMAQLKKAVHLWVENTKIGAYATSHLKVMIKVNLEKIHPSTSLLIS